MHLLLFLHLLIYAPVHPTYLSTCKIKIEDDRSWTASFRIFHDDLEDALQNQIGIRPTLNDSTLLSMRHDILTYLQKHFIVTSTSGEKLDFDILQLDIEQNVISIICAGHNQWSKSKHYITNDLLMEIFGSQKNVMTITCSEDIEALYFTKSTPKLYSDI